MLKVWRYSGYFIHQHTCGTFLKPSSTHIHSTDLFIEHLFYLIILLLIDCWLKPSWWPWGSAGQALKERIPLLSGATGANPGLHKTQMLQTPSNCQNSELEGFRKLCFYISPIQILRCIISVVEFSSGGPQPELLLPFHTVKVLPSVS